jgi:hypothetical protein
MYCFCLYAYGFQVLHLILHQSDKGRDNNTYTFERQSRNLKCYALASTSRHEPQSVVSGTDATDNVQLNAAKGGVAVVLLKYVQVVRCQSSSPASLIWMSSICSCTLPFL